MEMDVRTFLASRLAGKGKERFVDLAVERLSSQAIEFVAELKDFSYADLSRWGVPELLVKELQVFLKPHVPPVFAAPHFKATDVEGLLYGFWQELIGSLDGMANANEFKADHPFCKVSLCQVQGRPSLLWQGLEVHHHGASTKIYDLIARDKPALCILLGVSGAGKTRALYEIPVKRRCMFLTGMPPDRPLMEGSRDLLAVASTLERLYPEGFIPEIALQCCLKALFVVRFFIMQKSETFFNPLSNLTWLFKQVMHRQLRYIRPDPWHYLTNGILNLIKEPEHVQAMDTILTRMLHKDAASWDGFIMLDECQEVDQYLWDRFTSPISAGSEKRCSLLDKFVIALQDSGFTRATFIYAGTGRSLFHVASHVSETLKNCIDVCWFTSFGSFTDDKALRCFADNILVDTKGIDFLRLSQLYCGRYRFFVTALERYIENYRTDLDITNYLVQFAKDISTKRGTDVDSTG